MTVPEQDTTMTRVAAGLADGRPAARLRAALAAGTNPDPRFVGALVERCAVEPDFYVREMLTWALLRHDPSLTVDRLVGELGAPGAQARSQALHTLSKIGDRRAWPAITRELLTDADDEVARSAWRAAVALVPDGAEAGLAGTLAGQFGRGDRETRLSLSRALVALGAAIEPVLAAGTASADPGVRDHAVATRRLLHDPDAGFELAVDQATRIMALGPERAGS